MAAAGPSQFHGYFGDYRIEQCVMAAKDPNGKPTRFLYSGISYRPPNPPDDFIKVDMQQKGNKLVPFDLNVRIEAEHSPEIYRRYQLRYQTAKEYTFIKDLGQGAFSKVVEASRDGVSYAVKFQYPDPEDNAELVKLSNVCEESFVIYLNRKEQDLLEQIRRIGKTAESLVTTCYEGLDLTDIDGSRGRLSTYELCQTTLFEHFQSTAVHPLRDTKSVGYQLCNALEFFKRNGLIHFDINPKNIGMNLRPNPNNANKLEPHIKVLDFGCAHVLSDTEHGTYTHARLKPLNATKLLTNMWNRSPEAAALTILDTQAIPEHMFKHVNKAYHEHVGPGIDTWGVGTVLGQMYCKTIDASKIIDDSKVIDDSSLENFHIQTVITYTPYDKSLSDLATNVNLCERIRKTIGPMPKDLWTKSFIALTHPEREQFITGPLQEEPLLTSFLAQRKEEYGKDPSFEDLIVQMLQYSKKQIQDPLGHPVFNVDRVHNPENFPGVDMRSLDHSFDLNPQKKVEPQGAETQVEGGSSETMRE